MNWNIVLCLLIFTICITLVRCTGGKKTHLVTVENATDRNCHVDAGYVQEDIPNEDVLGNSIEFIDNSQMDIIAQHLKHSDKQIEDIPWASMETFSSPFKDNIGESVDSNSSQWMDPLGQSINQLGQSMETEACTYVNTEACGNALDFLQQYTCHDPFQSLSDDKNVENIKYTASTPKKKILLNETMSYTNTTGVEDLSERTAYDVTFDVETIGNVKEKEINFAAGKNEKKFKLRDKAIDAAKTFVQIKIICKYGCIQNINENTVIDVRNRFWSKDFQRRTEWLLDRLQESKIKGSTVMFNIHAGKKACSMYFRRMYRLPTSFFYKTIKMFQRDAISLGYRKGRGKQQSTVDCVTWFRDYAQYHGDRIPNREIVQLSYKTRKSSVYELYLLEHNSRMKPSVGKSTFFNIWQTRFPHLKIKKTNSFSKCDVCTGLEMQLEDQRNMKCRADIRTKIAAHNYRQMRERSYYYQKRDAAKANPKQYLSLIIDGMDQSKTDLPHFPGRTTKSLDPNAMLKTHLQGVLNHGLKQFSGYLDIGEYSHDSNLVMNIILKHLYDVNNEHNSKLPPILYIQADNCFRENKNRFVLAFCELLVRLNIFREVHLSFLIVGHTHEDIDAVFSKLSEKLRKTRAETIPRLLFTLGSTIKTEGLFDIKTWLIPHLNKISKHTKPLHYRFSRDSKNQVMMQYKSKQNQPWITSPNLGLKSLPSGKPNILLPPHFSKIKFDEIQKNIERVEYLFNEQSMNSWWKRFILEHKDMSTNEAKRISYDERGALWIMPLLPKQENNNMETTEHVIPQKLQEIIDQELEDHDIILTIAKSPKRKINKRKNVDKSGNGKTNKKAKQYPKENQQILHSYVYYPFDLSREIVLLLAMLIQICEILHLFLSFFLVMFFLLSLQSSLFSYMQYV